MNEKSLNILELPEVLRRLAAEAVCESAKAACLELSPSFDAAEVRRRKEETDCACRMMAVRGSPSFGGVKDVRASLARADLGGALSIRELLDIAGVLRCARVVRAYISADDSVGKTAIDCLFSALRANRHLEETISSSMASEDELADAASPELADIRRKMRAAAARAREALQKIISSPSYSKALQEQIITTRSDRYVVPVKAECRNAVPGLVHDISATGATLFIEPMGAVKANNELRELAAKEKIEIDRILAELSAECAAHRGDIESDYDLLVRLDIIFARAKLSYAMNCSPAAEGEGIVLSRARHPLLAPETAVPIDVELGEGFDTLVITGPNTGGKTVTLKTIGLLAAMNQCGLHIPASDGSTLPVFSHILADIGDEQSIEQNLSTFSAHMANIVSILDECDSGSLVLFDELGAGTDPAEGAALAVSIIERVRQKGAVAAATTHYTELKVYATNTQGVMNASCEFDVETLRPTYRLLLGIPGKSNAFAISRRLGLAEDIIEDARSRVSTDGAAFEATIENLEKTRILLEKDRDDARRKLREAEENAKKSAMLKAELEVRLEKAEIKARREAEQIISEARETAEAVFSELDEMKSHINEEDDVRRTNEARNELRRSLNAASDRISPSAPAKEDSRVSSRSVKPGDVVEIRSMGVKAEVLFVSPGGLLTLKAGIMTVTAKENEVYLLDNERPVAKKNPVVSSAASGGLRSAGVPMEIDLRGFECIEAVSAAEQYIDNAVMARLRKVTIIHGKGTGALRTAIHKMLRMNKNVSSFRLGVFGEGESGVTVVELK